jgi:hypothetical protein
MKQRIYIDTSVVGGCFDEEFEFESIRFFKMLEKNFFKILISPVLIKELEDAPKIVKEKLARIPRDKVEYLELNEDALFLRNLYNELPRRKRTGYQF